MNLVSFDLFDTVLVRRCGRPANIFTLVARQMFPENLEAQEKYVNWRVNAETYARQSLGKECLTLNEIYQTYPFANAELVAKTEVEIEKENLMVVPRMKDLIQEKRKQENRICFISDMYLPSKLLTEVLSRESCICDGEEVWVSCEHQARKSNGELYKKISRKMHPDEWIHYGDNLNSDVRRAREQGVKVVHIVHSYTFAEEELGKTSSIYSILAGNSRAVSLMYGDTSESRFAADFVAPISMTYVKWLFGEAKQRGIKRLYFLSRDSFLFFRIAQKVGLDEGISLHYLFLSRRALLLPYLAVTGFEERIFLRTVDGASLHARSLKEVLELFGMQEMATLFDFRVIRTKEQERKVLNLIFHSEQTSQWADKAQEQWNLLADYLNQEELVKGDSALVDVGWLGTGRMMLNAMLDVLKCPRTFFFYLGVRANVLPLQYGDWDSFFSSDELPTRLTNLIENYFYISPYQTTIGYRRDEKTSLIHPIFEEGETDTSLVNLHVAVAESMVDSLNRVPFSELELRRWCMALLRMLDDMNIPIDLTPLDGRVIRKLTCMECISYAFFGCSFERTAVVYSVGFGLGRILIALNRVSDKARRLIYQSFLKRA